MRPPTLPWMVAMSLLIGFTFIHEARAGPTCAQPTTHLNSGSTFTIATPGFPAPYAPAEICAWQLTFAVGKVHRLLLNASFTDVADSLAIYDGADESAPMMLGFVVEDTTPPWDLQNIITLQSTQHEVFVVFVSANQTKSSDPTGFKLVTTEISPPADACGPDSTTLPAFANFSVGGQAVYPPNYVCRHVFKNALSRDGMYLILRTLQLQAGDSVVIKQDETILFAGGQLTSDALGADHFSIFGRDALELELIFTSQNTQKLMRVPASTPSTYDLAVAAGLRLEHGILPNMCRNFTSLLATATPQTISDPPPALLAFPDAIPVDGRRCQWLIDAGPNRIVQFTYNPEVLFFSSVQLNFFDGADERAAYVDIGAWAARNKMTLQSTGRYLFIERNHDTFRQASALLNLTFASIPAVQECNAVTPTTSTATTGMVSTIANPPPNPSDSFPWLGRTPGQQCVYNIEIASAAAIYLRVSAALGKASMTVYDTSGSKPKFFASYEVGDGGEWVVYKNKAQLVLNAGPADELPGFLTVEYTGLTNAPAPICQGTGTIDASAFGSLLIEANATHHLGAGLHCFWRIDGFGTSVALMDDWLSLTTTLLGLDIAAGDYLRLYSGPNTTTSIILEYSAHANPPALGLFPGDPLLFKACGILASDVVLLELYTVRGRHNCGKICISTEINAGPDPTCHDRPNTFTNVVNEALILDPQPLSPLLCPFYFSLAPGAPETGFNVSVDLTTGVCGQWLSIFTNDSNVPLFRRDLVTGGDILTVYIEARSIRVEIYFYDQDPSYFNQVAFTVSKAFATAAVSLPPSIFPASQRFVVNDTVTVYPASYLSAQPGDHSELVFEGERGFQLDISTDLPGTGEAYVAIYDADDRLLRNFTSSELIASFWVTGARVVFHVGSGNLSAVYSGIAYIKYEPYEFHWCSGFQAVPVVDSAKKAWVTLFEDAISTTPAFHTLGPANLFCSWRIVGPRGHPLIMTTFNNPSLMPPDAYFLVYNGASTHSPLIANISRARPDYSHVTGGEDMYLEYHGGALAAASVSGKLAPVPQSCQNSVRRLLATTNDDYERVRLAGFNPAGQVCDVVVVLPYPSYPRSIVVEGYLGAGYSLHIFADAVLVASYGDPDAIVRISSNKPVTLLSGMNVTLRYQAGSVFDLEAIVAGVSITFPSEMPINSGVVVPVLPLLHLRPPRARALWSSTNVAVTPERMPELAQLHYCNHLCFLVNVTAVFPNLLMVNDVVRGTDCFFTFDAPELRVAHRLALLATSEYPLLSYPHLPKLEYGVIMCFAYAMDSTFSFPALYHILRIELGYTFPHAWNTPRLALIELVTLHDFTFNLPVFFPALCIKLTEEVHLSSLTISNPIPACSTILDVEGPNATVGFTTVYADFVYVQAATFDSRLGNLIAKNANVLTVCRQPEVPMESIVGDARWAFGVELVNVDVVLLPNTTVYVPYDCQVTRTAPLAFNGHQIDLRELAFSGGDITLGFTTLRDLIMPKLVSAPSITLLNNTLLESVQMCRLRYLSQGGFTVLGSPRLSCADMARYDQAHVHAPSALVLSPCDPTINGTLTTADCPEPNMMGPVPGNCPDPGTPLHGSRDYQGPFTDRSSVGFACDDGFRLLGVLALYCEGGTWDAPTPTCPMFDANTIGPSIESVTPQLAPLKTNVNISIMGSHWNLPLRHVYGAETEISRRTYSVFALSNSRRLLASTHALDFEVSARAQAGYYVVTIDDGFGLVATDDISLYFTDDCPTPGMYGIGLDCHPCPVGGYCPGGNRIWPLSGYWNSGEGSGFVSACPEPPTRCKGGRASGCDVGYEGPLCAVCSKGFYLRGTECVACPGREEEITLYVIAGVFYGALAVAFSFLSDDSVDMVVTILRVLQLIRAGTTQTGARLPEQAKRVLYYLSLVTFDFEFIKPACGFVSQLPTFSTLFWGNAVIVGLLVVPTFILLSVMRAVSKKRRTFFTNRMFRAVTIQITLLYYVVTTRAVQAITCIKIGGKYLLAADPSVECSLSDFLVVGGIGMAVFAVVIPLTFLFFVHRLVTSRRWADPTALARFGFLYQQLRVEVGGRYLYVIVPFLHLLMASVAWGVLKTGLGPYILSISSLSVVLAISIALRPFKRGLDNAIVTVTYGFGLSSVLLSFLTLSFLPVSVDTAWTVAGLVALLSLGVGFALFYSDLRRLAALENKVAPAPAATTEPDEKGAELATFSGVQELPSCRSVDQTQTHLA